MKLAALIFFPFALFATVNNPPQIALLSGYRNDHIHWHLKQGDTFLSSERTRNIQFFENGLSFQTVHRDIALYAAGGYGALGRGELKEQLGHLPFTNDTPVFLFSTHGWAIDGTGYVGYAVNLTPERTYQVKLIPLAGFSGHYEVMTREGYSSFETPAYTISTSFPKNYQQTWYGPNIGALFQIEPGNNLQFQVGYAYHWLHLRVSTQSKEQTNFPDTPTITSKFTLSRWGNFGHSGLVGIETFLNKSWRIGAILQMNYYFSGNHPIEVEQRFDSTAIIDKETFKLRWFSIRGLISISKTI